MIITICTDHFYRTSRETKKKTMSKILVQQNPSKTDATGTKDFVLYNEVSLAQELVDDHAPLTIVPNYDGVRLWIMKL